jgi:hypothetical protein
MLKCFFLKTYFSIDSLRQFLKTEFGKWLFHFRNMIKQTFNQLKNDGLEQPRWYGFNRFLLRVQRLSHKGLDLTRISQ